MMKIFEDVAASRWQAIADDGLKDEDAGLWLTTLPTDLQALWRERFTWIRWVDRLAEQDRLVNPGGRQFPDFYAAWQRLREQGYLDADDRHWSILRQIEAHWFRDSRPEAHEPEIVEWDNYMKAMVDYHCPALVLETLSDYEQMLERLAGACFRLMPCLQESQRAIAGYFGIIDQGYNNLRDLYEDTRCGICYFPRAVLQTFGITRAEILNLTCFDNPGYRPLMTYWLDSYLPRLRRQYSPLVHDPDLHPAWQCLIAWCGHRYLRVDRIFRACNYDFVAFAPHYWSAVRQELAHCPPTQAPVPIDYWLQHRVSVLAVANFLAGSSTSLPPSWQAAAASQA